MARKTATKSKPIRGNHLKPQFAGFFGKTGSGKSHAMRLKFQEWQAEDPRQVLVWSPKEEQDNYAGWLRCRAYANILDLVKAARDGKNCVFIPSRDRAKDEPKFNLFNRLAYELAPVCMIVDELHTITKATGGVPAWHETTTMGRGRGMRVLASSQRPAHVDKDFYGALSYAWCGAQLFNEDVKTTASLVLVKPEQILALTGHEAITRSM